MISRGASVLIGLALYFSLVLIFYGLHRLAFTDGSGPSPLWYYASEVTLKAITSAAPGIVSAWLCHTGGLAAGAMVGVIGGVVGSFLLSALYGVPFAELGGRIAVATVVTTIASAITNAVGGLAGEALRAKINPSSRIYTDFPRDTRETP